MKNIYSVLFALFFLTLGFNSQAQIQVGAGAALWFEGETAFGVQGIASYPASEKIDLTGTFTYWFGDFIDYSININGHYALATIGDNISVAPMAGINITNGGATNTAINVGVFFEIPQESMTIYAEPKFILDSGTGLVISGGLFF